MTHMGPRPRFHGKLAVTAIFFVLHQAAAAQDTNYLKDLPEPDRVFAETHGVDEADTKARRAAAMELFSSVLLTLADWERTPLTPEEKALNTGYQRLLMQACDDEIDNVRYSCFGKLDEYFRDASFRTDLLTRYLRAATRHHYWDRADQQAREFQAKMQAYRPAARLRAQSRASESRPRSRVDQTRGQTSLASLAQKVVKDKETSARVGLVLLGAGVVLGIWRLKRKFERTGVGGVEEFKSFSGMIGTKLLDWAVTWGGGIIALIGILLLMYAVLD